MLKFKKGISIFIHIFGIACFVQCFLQDMQVQAFEVTIPASVTVNLNETTVNVPGTVTVASSSTLQLSTGTITVSNNGNWSNSGTFTAGSGNVQFAGTSHAINGSSTFYNLNCNISGGQITFEASKRQTISNLLTLKGASGSYLTLRSSSTGAQWELYPQGTMDINYVDVKDSNNVGSSRIQPSNWTDSSNNTNWGTAPDTGSQPVPTPVTLSVSSVSPSSGATGVAVNATVSATFSLLMNGSTLTTSTFKLSGGGGDVSGAVTTNGATATFTPSSNLANNTTYTATITTGAQAANAAGTTLSSNYTWSFTTISAGVSTPTPTVTTSPSPTPAVASSPTPVSLAAPTQTPTPTPTTPGVSSELYLSKTAAYLSGDTVAVTVVDADRDANAASEDTLTTAIKVTALGYYAGGDLMLDLKENGANSGTFLATIKTGAATTGGASSGTRSNIGVIKTVQGGTATVIYTGTAPNVSTIAKTLSFSSSDATLAFDAESYTVGSYAVVTYVDAEENSDHTQAETLLNHGFIETSSVNRAWMRLAETGADTGTFKGSILVSNTATLDYERIQASGGDTLTAGCPDEINTSGAPRQVTAISRVLSLEPTPTPSATPVLSPTPSPVECTAVEMSLSPVKLDLRKNGSGEVTVTVTGADGCPVEGKQVKVEIRTGRCLVTVSPASQETDEDGQAVFTIEANKATGLAKITFSAEELQKSMNVKVPGTKRTDWIINPANGHQYKAVKGGSWLKCKKLAEEEGAYLVTINNRREQQWLVKTFGVDRRYSIGLTDRSKEGVWKWVSGEKVTYTNWKSGEPNNLDGCEDYAVMNWNSSGEWNDIGPCHSQDWKDGEWGIIEKACD